MLMLLLLALIQAALLPLLTLLSNRWTALPYVPPPHLPHLLLLLLHQHLHVSCH
jgi:hypothetical protein